MPPLRPPAFDHPSPTSAAHSNQKAVDPLASPSLGLICSLHSLGPFLTWWWSASKYNTGLDPLQMCSRHDTNPVYVNSSPALSRIKEARNGQSSRRVSLRRARECAQSKPCGEPVDNWAVRPQIWARTHGTAHASCHRIYQRIGLLSTKILTLQVVHPQTYPQMWIIRQPHGSAIEGCESAQELPGKVKKLGSTRTHSTHTSERLPLIF